MKLKKVDIRERAELEPMLVDELSVIEDGMRLVAHQLATPSGPLDILAVDEDGALALMELKNEVDEDEAVLLQALRYYDWVIENRAWIANIHSPLSIDPTKEPRLMLVAPGFSAPLKRLAKYLSLEVELFRYQAVEDSSGQRSLVVNPDFFDERPEVPRITSIPQIAERLSGAAERAVFSQALEDLKGRGFEVQPRARDTLSGFYRGRRILRVYMKNSFFAVRLQHADGSMTGRIRVAIPKDWVTFLDDHLVPRLSEIDASDGA